MLVRYARGLFLWDGLKTGSMYNQDWLFCWCLQVRMGGVVHLDNGFEDVQFPAHKCTMVAEAARHNIGTHHTSPRKLHALWRAYTRSAVREGWQWNGTAAILAAEAAGAVGASVAVAFENDSARATAASTTNTTTTKTKTTTTDVNVTTAMSVTGALLAAAGGTMPPDPSDPQRCATSSKGDPYELIEGADADADERRWAASSLPRPAPADTCASAAWEDDAALRSRYPHCSAHMAFVIKHARTMACYGALGRKRCDGFELDVSDACNVQYYLFCEQVFAFSATPMHERQRYPWCPSPKGYPDHCCYRSALEDVGIVPLRNASGAAHVGRPRSRTRRPARYLLDIFPRQVQVRV